MMPVICLDPCAIWMVDGTDGLDGVEDFILRSLQWLQVGRGLAGQPHVVSSSVTALANLLVYPVVPWFEIELERLGLAEVISAKTLASSVNRFLAAAPSLEDSGAFKDALIADTSADPDVFSSIHRPELRQVSTDALAFVALNTSQPAIRDVQLAHPRLSAKHLSSRVTGNVVITETNPGFQNETSSLDTKVSIVRNQADFLENLDATALWADADNSVELELAIALRARDVGRFEALEAVPTFRVGSEFSTTLQAAQCARNGVNAGVALEKCARLVADPALVGAEPFRTTEKTTSSPRLRGRDQAVAMRAHITEGHEALRLMYWRRLDGVVEFACVRNKRDLMIDEGDQLPSRLW